MFVVVVGAVVTGLVGLALAIGGVLDILQGFRVVYAVIEAMSKHTVAGGADLMEDVLAAAAEGAALLTAERYCADGWETASNFLSGTHLPYPECAEAVIDPQVQVVYLDNPGLVRLWIWPLLITIAVFAVLATSVALSVDAMPIRLSCPPLMLIAG